MTLEKFIEKLIEIYSVENKDCEIVIPTKEAGSESVLTVRVGLGWGPRQNLDLAR